jgi:3D (Asp-Asp-Asp) domain-containing protein
MNRPNLLVLAAILIAPLVTSCSTGVNVLSKGDIQEHGHGIKFSKKQKFTPNTPNSSLVTKASSKPKDKHSMPIYSYNERNRVVRTTAYTCSEADHLIYGSKNAAGTNLRYSNKVRSAAADWSFYPVGTVFKIKGMDQLYVIDDYGSALTGTGTIDLYQPSRSLMNQWGRRNVEISVVQWGSFKRSADLLAGRTAFSHCRSMLANIHRQRPDLKNVASR